MKSFVDNTELVREPPERELVKYFMGKVGIPHTRGSWSFCTSKRGSKKWKGQDGTKTLSTHRRHLTEGPYVPTRVFIWEGSPDREGGNVVWKWDYGVSWRLQGRSPGGESRSHTGSGVTVGQNTWYPREVVVPKTGVDLNLTWFSSI